MPRPTEHENLKTTSVTIPNRDLQLAKDMGLNLSEIFRDAVSMAINKKEKLDRLEDKKDDQFKKIPKRIKAKMSAYVSEDPRRANRWADIANTKCGTSLTGQDIVEFVTK